MTEPRARLPWRWLVVAAVLGLLLGSGAAGESPGRWLPDPARAVAVERAWINGYLLRPVQPGDRINTSLTVALAEGEYAWARLYLARQAAALQRATARLAGSEPAATTARILACYQAALAGTPAPPPGQVARLLSVPACAAAP